MCLQSSNCCKPGESLLLLPLLDSRGGPTQPSPSPPRYIDFDMLVADHAKRQRWADLCEHVLIPPLRRMSVVIATKSHLMESTATDVLNKVMPALERQVPCFMVYKYTWPNSSRYTCLLGAGRMGADAAERTRRTLRIGHPSRYPHVEGCEHKGGGAHWCQHRNSDGHYTV